MKPVSIAIAAKSVRLESLTNFELRAEWRRLHHMQPPKCLSRDLLLRGITYKRQERASGGLSMRKLTGAGPDTTSDDHRRTALRTEVKPETRLVRDWNRDTHTVLVHADGVEWRGQRYRSLL